MLEFEDRVENRLEDLEEICLRVEQKLDKLLEKKKPVNRKSSHLAYPDMFIQLWDHYPKRAGSNPKHKAYCAYSARINEVESFSEIHLGVLRYFNFCEATGKTGTEFVMQAATFFGPEKHYENMWQIPVTEKLPRNNDELESWAVENGHRTANPGETYAQYRIALNRLISHKEEEKQ